MILHACFMQINSGEYKQIVIFDHVTRRKLWKQFQQIFYHGHTHQANRYTHQANRYYVTISFQSVSYEVQPTSNHEHEEGIREVWKCQKAIYFWDNRGALVQLCAAVLLKERRIQNTTITCPFGDNSQFVWGHQKLWLMSSSTQWYNLLVPVWVNIMLTNFYMMILHEGDGWHVCGLVLTTTYMQGYHVLSVLFMKQGVCHTVALLFTLKKYLKAKEELWKFKYFTMQKYNLKKKKPPL
jgi:hypothetical protein